MRLLVTGGAGFIGSALCRHLIHETQHEVINLDALTYAANLASLALVADHPRYRFVNGDIRDRALVDAVLAGRDAGGDRRLVDAIVHLAAESHVDRSIDGPAAFLETNVTGTFTLLQAARAHRDRLGDPATFRFLHVSTDEVYGALPLEGGAFDEDSPYRPSSPYAATKAASDHLVRAWGHTFALPVIVSNASNNFGPYQFPEKLIPLTILNALEGQSLPVYGRGENVRDWMHVDDHVRALTALVERGSPGRTYIVGARNERSNLSVVEQICDILDKAVPHISGPRRRLITFVADRPGHDLRYAVDPTRLETELGWRPRQTFEAALAGTVAWYLDNASWWRPLRERYAGGRLGTLTRTG